MLVLGVAKGVAAQDTAPPPDPAPAAPTVQETPAPAPLLETATGNTGASLLPESAPPPASEDPHVALMRKELSRLSLERDKLTAENMIARAKLEKELADRRAEMEREKLRLDEQRQKDDVRLAEERRKLEEQLVQLRMESERLAVENSIAKAKAEILATEQRIRETEAKARISELQARMETEDVEHAASNYAGTKPLWLEEPLQGDTLIISDRRISLNGPITMETAKFVSERVNYFNNKSPQLPIFLVIDNSPGGSVMAGYNILKSMESSEAPVYVVVKSFAASMAACITTCADRSFCYPNAVILHHQISGVAFGNLTSQRENLREVEEWWRRLAEPVARKMGLTTEEFIQKMYDQVKSGDWAEFGDKAQSLKWVDYVVKEIRETSLVKNPDAVKPSAASTPAPAPIIRPSFGAELADSPQLPEATDEKGQPFVRLSRLAPKDFYYLYNPDGYYRLP